MNHRTSHILYGYWNEVRGDRMAPTRFEIEPSRITEILAETFILERIDSRSYPFRLAGTKICDQLGTEFRGRNFLEVVPAEDRSTLEHIFNSISEQGAVGVLEIESQDRQKRPVAFEVLVLPLVHGDSGVTRFLGSLAAIDPPIWLGYEQVNPSGLIRHTLIWPDGRPHAVLARNNRQAPFIPELANARVVRQNRRQFRILDGGRTHSSPDRIPD